MPVQLLQHNLDVLYETWISGPLMAEDRVAGILMENKNGRSAYKAFCIVDCTADADLVFRAGGHCHIVILILLPC